VTIRVISPDRKTFRFITSPAMKHAATIAIVEAAAVPSRPDGP
jgi:hypothetical protein